jgi:hypothetical protein
VKPEAAVTSPEISIKPGTQIKIVLDKFWTSAGMNVVLWGSAPTETLLQLYVQRTLIVYWLKYVEAMFLKHACLSCVPYDVKYCKVLRVGPFREMAPLPVWKVPVLAEASKFPPESVKPSATVRVATSSGFKFQHRPSEVV